METSSFPQSGNQNSLIEGSFFDSNWFNPDYLFTQGYEFFKNLSNYTVSSSSGIISIFNSLLFFFAFFFLVIISYTIVRMLEIRKKEHAHLKHEIAEYAHQQKEREKQAEQSAEVSKNPRWVQTLTYLFSQHSSDWKLAVIEADSMLESLMDDLGFKGDTLGEKLKSATQERFRNLTAAWEVHNIRNRIAHEGVAFEMTQREAKRIITIYEQIFREFGYI